MKKRLSMLLAASAAVSLLLAGCGGDSEPSEDKNSEEKVNTESNDTQKKEEEEKESDSQNYILGYDVGRSRCVRCGRGSTGGPVQPGKSQCESRISECALG